MEKKFLRLHLLPEVDFEVKGEYWNVYLLDDDSRLFFKTVAIKFFKLADEDPITGLPVFLMVNTNLVTVKSDKRGDPNVSASKFMRLRDVPRELRTVVGVKRVLSESWNSYVLEGKYVFEVKPVITDIYRIEGYYDEFGYPVYHVLSQNVNRLREKGD